MKETTDICYTYERGKVGKGGKLLSVVFHVMKNTNYVDQLTLNEFIARQPEPLPLTVNTPDGDNYDKPAEEYDDYEDEHEILAKTYGSEQLADLAESCGYEFDKEQMNVIFGLLRDLPIPPDRQTKSLHFGRVIWLNDMYNKFMVAAHQAELYGEPIHIFLPYDRKL